MKKIKSIAIVTTRQNYKWTSMQEVLPGIEKCWEWAAIDQQCEFKIINVDIDPLRNYIKYILDCDAFVIIAFNETISRFMKIARKTLNIPAPFIFHLYGHSTLGLWPEERFGVLNIMNEGDVFIGTCPGDVKCMKLTMDNAKVYEVPYPYFPVEVNKCEGEKGFAYVGRISDQKNLDVLIKAYGLLKQENYSVPPLFIYGKEDHFGSPNMGIASSNCLLDLENLIAQLGLQKDIVFKGFVSREQIYNELSDDHIFVSASTHSDENFGMALLRSIAVGGLAIVSHWGGHQVFKSKMPDRVWTVPVHFENNRPVPIVNEFKRAMEEVLSISKSKIEFKEGLPYCFSPKGVSEHFCEILMELNCSSTSLKITSIAQKMYEQQKYYEENGQIQRVFDSYEDPLAKKFLEAYL